MKRFLPLFLLALLPSTVLANPPLAKIDFKRDVVPLLEARCFSCHRGPDATASYRLDLRAELLGETTGKPLVQIGKSADSRLIQAVLGKTPGKVMPRKGPRLTEREIDLLRAWIDQGLAWDDRLFPAESKSDHWAFQPIKNPPLPKVKNAAWIATPIDAFIAVKHEQKGLVPSPPADPRTLIRRLYFDLIGLPPTPEEVEAFVNDNGANSVALVVDKLLASPHYGERWGRHWLDIARWAESEGYESNHPRPFAWRYRDWVVRSFNRDLPFADFVRQQLAGDEIQPYADEHVIATGFLAAARLSSNEEDRARQRNDIYVDIVNTTANAFLGLTMQCAQCHNHKFDAITARDYYRFQGFFVKAQPGNLALRDPKLWADYEAKKVKGYDEVLKVRDALYETAHQRKIEQVRKTLTPQQKQVLELPREQRTPEQDKLALETDLLFQFAMGEIHRALTPDEKKRYDAARKTLAEMEKSMVEKPQTFGFYSPATSPHRIAMLPMKGFYPLPYNPKQLDRAKPFLYEAGDVRRPAFVVDVGWPEVFGPAKNSKINVSPRLALADWLTSKENPLAARVYVNRIWQQHFGVGLVATASDFGVKGAQPTHPDLLDWLTAEFLRGGGSTKHLHRLIVLSRTYRQAAQKHTGNAHIDPENQYWWHWQPRRLEAEAIRDAYLAVAGELDCTIGGSSVADDDKSLRRSIYLLQKREAPPGQQALFDGPIAMTESCARRGVTTVPLQPLYLLNASFSVKRATALATRVVKLTGNDQAKQIAATYRLTQGRAPDAKEQALAQRFFERVATAPVSDKGPPSALVHYCQAILNLNEFVYLE